MKLKGVLFDLDGTIVEVPYDWKRIKEELGTQGKPILSFLQELPEPEKSKKRQILEKYEQEATRKAVLKEGMDGLLEFLSENRIKKAVVTNNSRKNVRFLLKKFNLDFDCVISRESGLWKPSGSPFLEVLERFSLKAEECCAVGDSHYDIKAAREAGIPWIFILGPEKTDFSGDDIQFFSTVSELKEKVKELIKGEH
ncbi:HAD family phosphatase [bacterium]|nr:HAD family phosphatase [bacterium]